MVADVLSKRYDLFFLLVKKLLENYIEMTKALELFMHFVLRKDLWMIIMCLINFYLKKYVLYS